MDDIEEIRDELEAVAIELFEQTTIELLLATLGEVIHVIVCSDDSISDEMKAAYVTLMIGKHMTPSAISHFDNSQLTERISDLIAVQDRKRLN